MAEVGSTTVELVNGAISGEPDTGGGQKKRTVSLHPILVRHNSFEEEEDYFKPQMRQRANTDPISPRPRLHHHLKVHFDLPDIVVDDCSDNDEENVDSSHPEKINRDLANTEQGAFFVFKSPPRQRSNTCPKNMFSTKKKTIKNRPPTPPPNDDIAQEGFHRYPSWEKVSFSPHQLTRVSEDSHETTRESVKYVDKTQTSKSFSPVRSRKAIASQSESKAARAAKPPMRRVPCDSPGSSPKRIPAKLPNGHVPTKSNNHRDVIHSSA